MYLANQHSMEIVRLGFLGGGGRNVITTVRRLDPDAMASGDRHLRVCRKEGSQFWRDWVPPGRELGSSGRSICAAAALSSEKYKKCPWGDGKCPMGNLCPCAPVFSGLNR